MSLVAIVGRPNVGKSTLFNRLVGMRQAIVDETSGVTRDRHYGKCEWCGTTFSVVDTGGYTSNSDDVFEEEIRKQVVLAIEEADLILFLTECGTGITDYDEEIADILRRSGKPVVLAVNKVDSGAKMYDSYQFYSLGLGEVWSISSANGGGTGDLLDEIVRRLPSENKDAEDERPDLPHIAIVGRPNVGKSSLTNALLGTERNIVTPVAGTTRDSIATYYNKFGHEFMLVDTAGMRKKSKVHEDLEFYSVMRSVRAIEHSDICILMIDAQTGLESQDMSIFNLIIRNLKGCVIVVNKWDLVEKDSNTMKEYEAALKYKEEHGTCPAVYNIRFIKPVDTALLEKAGKDFHTIITVEDGALAGGLYGEISEYFAGRRAKPEIIGIGIPDRFIEQGTQAEEQSECGLDTESIYSKIEHAIEGK